MIPKNVKMWIGSLPVESTAIDQITDMASLEILAGHIAIMPDVHWGIGATVGTVIPTRKAIIPAAVGVDIGCGMCAVRTSLTASDLGDSVEPLFKQISRDLPVGFGAHKSPILFNPDRQWKTDVGLLQMAGQMTALNARFEKLRILERLKKVTANVWDQVGTMGGGNHFAELCLDEEQRVWMMLHSGSRGIGNTIGRCAIEMAKEIAHKQGLKLPNKDLAWLDEGSPEFETYIEALHWAQEYAMLNRKVMLFLFENSLRRVIDKPFDLTAEAVNCHHNYAQQEEHGGEKVWITRKGAVSAKLGEFGIIPGSMGAKSFIVRGKGNADSYHSCSHGAGRKMARNKAKQNITVEQLIEQTQGVVCRKDAGVLDEAPDAYKSIDLVMEAQTDLVEVVHTLKQVMCLKG